MDGVPLWQDELEGLEEGGQYSLPIGVADADEPEPDLKDSTHSSSSARRSIHNLAEDALTFGRYGSLNELYDDVGRLHQYAPFNALLALLQRPAASLLLPAHKWRDTYRRPIRPGEHPVVMLQPGGPVMFLFDVSQTEAAFDSRPLPPRLGNPFAMQDVVGAEQAVNRLIENAKVDGVRMTAVGEGLNRAGCIWSYQRGLSQRVVYAQGEVENVWVRWESLFNRSYSATERLATIAHELGHLYCGHVGTWDPDRWPKRRLLGANLEELEAESVARVVFRRLFPDAVMPAYREFTPGLDIPDMPPISLDLVMRAATWIVQDTLGPRRHPARAVYAKSRHPLPRTRTETA